MYERKYTPENILSLADNEIFVFGSNLAGNHAGGAARTARQRFGAVMGQGTGLQGQSYAIPTMQGGVETIAPYVDDFVKFATKNPELKFFVTRIGCGIAGFKDEEIAPLFDAAFDLPNVVLPKDFWQIINHARQLASETQGLVFHSTPIEYFPEDVAKAEGMSHQEKIDFYISLKEINRYKVVHDSPEAPYWPPLFNCSEQGHHWIAITTRTFAIAVNNKLYSNDFSWGLDCHENILSVIPLDKSDKDYPYGQYVVLLADGSVKLIWSECCFKSLSHFKDFNCIASGCGGAIFGLRNNGTVVILRESQEGTALSDVLRWDDIIQIDAGPRHIVGLRKDGSVVAAGKESACKPLKQWQNIQKIYVSKAAPIFGKVNDLTFGIDYKGWLHVEGDLWSKGEEFWKRIRAQYEVTDIIENGYAVWVRTQDREIRCVTYYSKMNYQEEIDFVKKYSDGLRFMEAYGDIMLIVDSEGEFRVLNTSENKEAHWWSFNLKD